MGVMWGIVMTIAVMDSTLPAPLNDGGFEEPFDITDNCYTDFYSIPFSNFRKSVFSVPEKILPLESIVAALGY